jgi:alpha-galactosidase
MFHTRDACVSRGATRRFLLPTPLLLGLCLVGLARTARAVDVLPEEMAEARRWVAAKFEGVIETRKLATGLNVLASYGPICRNAHGQLPLKLGEKVYKRGFYCHAPSRIVVCLPGAGRTFRALVGINSNSMTIPGRGSIVCSVVVAGKQAFRSGVLREGMPGAPIRVDLAGATQFTVEVGDAGDGISCDQSAWVDAQVALADGRTVWLGDLPVHWAARGAYTAEPPFSFTYNGKPSAELLAAWPLKRSTRRLDVQRREHRIEYRDPQTGLAVGCVAVEYRDFPTVEWTLSLTNTGTADTPLVEGLQAIDTRFDRNPEGEFTLHHWTGSICAANDYEPHATTLEPKAAKRITTSGGRPTNSDLPYFNLEWPGEGVIVVVGWPGQWAAEFRRDEGTGLQVRGGQELTRFKLHPGETVRGPLALVQFWKGDWVRAQNVWRRWMLAHNLPRPGGRAMPPALMMCTTDFYPGLRSNAKDEMKYVDAYTSAGVKLDYWWIDAGWYPCQDGWWQTGTWEPDPQRYPQGLRQVSDYVHSKRIKLVVWFEPERVHAGRWLAEKHPEWVLGGKAGGLLNLGQPQARAWLTEHIDRILTGQGIDLYRQDFNIDPLDYWRKNDGADRQGITEIRHVEGYLAYWDELRRRHPAMPIDSCASGGRRNDLETLRRAVPLLRSDYRFEPVGTQGHTYGIAFWIPYYGTGVFDSDDYVVRSHWCPWLAVGRNEPRKPGLDWTNYHRMIADWRKAAGYLLGDYWPLTSYSLDNSQWMAWQFDRPDLGEGLIQAFRRAESPYESARFHLRGLDPDAQYTLTDLDTGAARHESGRELVEKGLLVTVPTRPTAVVILYKRKG